MDLATYLNNLAASTQAWIAEDPDNRWAITPVTEVAYWAEQGITTVEQYIRSGLLCEYSDAYKSAYNFRPRGHTEQLASMTNEQIEAEIKSLYAYAMADAEREAEEMRIEEDWRKQEDKREAEAKAEAEWVEKWEGYYERLEV